MITLMRLPYIPGRYLDANLESLPLNIDLILKSIYFCWCSEYNCNVKKTDEMA